MFRNDGNGRGSYSTPPAPGPPGRTRRSRPDSECVAAFASRSHHHWHSERVNPQRRHYIEYNECTTRLVDSRWISSSWHHRFYRAKHVRVRSADVALLLCECRLSVRLSVSQSVCNVGGLWSCMHKDNRKIISRIHRVILGDPNIVRKFEG